MFSINCLGSALTVIQTLKQNQFPLKNIHIPKILLSSENDNWNPKKESS